MSPNHGMMSLLDDVLVVVGTAVAPDANITNAARLAAMENVQPTFEQPN